MGTKELTPEVIEMRTHTIECMTSSRIAAVIIDLKQTLADCEKMTVPNVIVESQRAQISKLKMAITAMESIRDKTL